MKLTPLDLQQKSFRKGRLGGLDEKEVRAYLDFVATELEDLTRKFNRQDEELRRREARINEFKDREQLLQQTLTTAQRLSEEMKAHGRKEADIVLSDAELQRRWKEDLASLGSISVGFADQGRLINAALSR